MTQSLTYKAGYACVVKLNTSRAEFFPNVAKVLPIYQEVTLNMLVTTLD